MSIPRGLLLSSLALMSACRLIDQRTFESRGTAPASVQLSGARNPSLPLAVIRFGSLDPNWRGPLLDAARAAQTRKADVVFDLVTPIPVAAPISVQDAAADTGAADAATVAQALQADGVDPSRVRIGSRGDRGNPPRQVEVFVQ